MGFHDYVEQVIAFVRDNAGWAPPIVFALAFGESLAFISLLIPAWGALVAIGALIGPSGINFWPVWIAGSLGAGLGDWLSYWVGLKLEYSVAKIWPLSRHPELIPRGRGLREKMGRARHFHRPVLRAAARRRCRWSPEFSRCRSGGSRLANFSSAFVWAAVLLTLGDGVSVGLQWLFSL